MTDYLNFVNNLVDAAKHNRKVINKNKPKRKVNRWKYCAALLESGYISTVCTKAEKGYDLIFTWSKEGEKEINVRLSFVEQQLWLEYLERRAAKEKQNGERESD